MILCYVIVYIMVGGFAADRPRTPDSESELSQIPIRALAECEGF